MARLLKPVSLKRKAAVCSGVFCKSPFSTNQRIPWRRKKYRFDSIVRFTSFGESLNRFFPTDHCLAFEWRRLKIWIQLEEEKEVRLNLLIITMGLNHRHFNFTLSNLFSNFLEEKIFEGKTMVSSTWISFFNCSLRRRITSIGIWDSTTVPFPSKIHQSLVYQLHFTYRNRWVSFYYLL